MVKQLMILPLLLSFLAGVGAQSGGGGHPSVLAEARRVAERAVGDREAWESYGYLVHDAVLTSGGISAKEGVEVWEKIYRLFPSPRNRAYLGSSWNLVARDAENALEKIDGVTKALAELDGAVEEDPQDPVIRRIRYQNCLGLPDMFGRDSTADTDLDFLLGLYKKSPQIFDDLFDPAHIFLSKARLLRKKNSGALSLGLARTALRIVKDPRVKAEIMDFME